MDNDHFLYSLFFIDVYKQLQPIRSIRLQVRVELISFCVESQNETLFSPWLRDFFEVLTDGEFSLIKPFVGRPTLF